MYPLFYLLSLALAANQVQLQVSFSNFTLPINVSRIGPHHFRVYNQTIDDLISQLLQQITSSNNPRSRITIVNTTNIDRNINGINTRNLSNAILHSTERNRIQQQANNTPNGRQLNNQTRNRSSRRNSKEGQVRLVGGQSLFEGNVEINHLGQWGSICDDEWDIQDANVICRQLGFVLGAMLATTDSQYGKARKLIWMDNLVCSGEEHSIKDCGFDGWKSHDCNQNEAAGVICRTRLEQKPIEQVSTQNPKPTSTRTTNVPEPVTRNVNVKFKTHFDEVKLRLVGGEADHHGRIEVWSKQQWHLLCGDGWSIHEAQVVCRQLKMGYADQALHFKWNGSEHRPIISGLNCVGDELDIGQCEMIESNNYCFDSYNDVAGVSCVPELPDLIINVDEIQRSAYLEDRSIMFLQCAMEENCLSRSAYEIDKNDPAWVYETRRLLRFTASIANIGKIDFRPFAPKSQWVWHSCHRHYHSMEVFAHFDILDEQGNRVAEGHKASFCLEDNLCNPGHRSRFACADYGDQGISVGCVDIYKYDLDCQWVDITDIKPGNYYFKITINPEMKVPELSFSNNAAYCHFQYTPIAGYVTNCTLIHP